METAQLVAWKYFPLTNNNVKSSLGITKSISDTLPFTTRAARCESIHRQVAVEKEGFSLLLFKQLLFLLQEKTMANY